MQKIKSVLRSSRRNRSPSSGSPRQSYESSDATSPRADHYTTPSRGRDRAASDASYGVSPLGPRSRPVSSIYDDRRASGSHSGYAQANASDPINGSIANDYKAYLPALSPVDDAPGDSYMTLGGDRRLAAGESDGRHEEDVADRNIERYRSSIDASRNKPLPSAPNGASDWPLSNGGPHTSEINGGASRSHPNHGKTHESEGMQHPKSAMGDQTIRMVGQPDQNPHGDWKTQQQSLLDGVVDLRNTVDTDKETRVAARMYKLSMTGWGACVVANMDPSCCT